MNKRIFLLMLFLILVSTLDAKVTQKSFNELNSQVKSNTLDINKTAPIVMENQGKIKELIFQKYVLVSVGVFIGIFLIFLFKHTLERISTIEDKYKDELKYLRQQIDNKVGDLSNQYKQRSSDIQSIKDELHQNIECDIEATYSDQISTVTEHYFEFIKNYVNDCGCDDKKENVLKAIDHEMRKISRLLNVTNTDETPKKKITHF